MNVQAVVYNPVSNKITEFPSMEAASKAAARYNASDIGVLSSKAA